MDKCTSIWGPKPPTKCATCNGSGHYINEERFVPGEGYKAEIEICPQCDGDGYIPVKQ